MKYRAEIDGLRAFAVIPVIFFHAGANIFSGGYVGVDIFFVISGYLITTIIQSEIEHNNFSLINFYERRAKRILPVLFFILFITLPFSWFLLSPHELKDYAQSLVSVSTFSSNILFWSETGYWGSENELKPLLHTWSLAVEEQFYLFFPLLLMLLWRFNKKTLFIVLSALTLSSFLLSNWAAYHYPNANFFMLPNRAWELAAGSLIAFYNLHGKHKTTTKFNSNMSFLGLTMLLYSIFFYDDSIPFPSFYTITPVLGSVLIIMYASSDNFTGKLLSHKFFTFIGLISYSAYLWHQPILAFTRQYNITGSSSNTILVFMALLSFPLAFLSWKYIEVPFRKKNVFTRKGIFVFSLIGSLFFISIGLIGHFNSGFNKRVNLSGVTYQTIEEKLNINYGLSPKCDEHQFINKSTSSCSTSDSPKILVWGDSFAMHLVPGILQSIKSEQGIVQMTKSSCGPFFSIAPVSQHSIEWTKSCLQFNSDVKTWLKNNQSIQYIIISSPFTSYLNNEMQVLDKNGTIQFTNEKLAISEFLISLDYIKSIGKIPIIISPPPTNGLNIGRCLLKAEWRGLPLKDCDFKVQDISDKNNKAFKFLEKINQFYPVIFLNKKLCDLKTCSSHSNTIFIYRDNGHLSIEGSKYLFHKIKLNEIMPKHQIK